QSELPLKGHALLGFLLEVFHLALGLGEMGPFPIKKGYPGTVITAVFQSLKAFDNDGIGIPMADIANYSTHKINFRFIPFIGGTVSKFNSFTRNPTLPPP